MVAGGLEVRKPLPGSEVGQGGGCFAAVASGEAVVAWGGGRLSMVDD
jgi:hypothetical protein